MKGIVSKHLMNKTNNGVEYYLNIIEEENYKKFEKEYESITTTVEVNKFTDRWDVKPSDIILYGASPFKEPMSREEQQEVGKLLEAAMPKPVFGHNPIYGKAINNYKCWMTDKYPNLNIAGHNSIFSSFNCLLTKLHKPDYIIITIEKSKQE